jgi:hypothetical protein
MSGTRSTRITADAHRVKAASAITARFFMVSLLEADSIPPSSLVG